MKNKLLIFLCVLVVCVLYSCAPKPYAASNKIYKNKAREFAKNITAPPVDSVLADSLKVPANWAGTTNFGMRRPSFVIIHHTAQNSCEKTIETFTTPVREVSAHYVICKDGTLHHMLNDYLRAWHAGAGRWGNETDINSVSIGIEIDNNGTDSFSVAQLNTLYGVLAFAKKEYNIPVANFIGHGDITPGRKVDPSVLFPWKDLADKGFGLWYSDTTNIIVPADFNVRTALRIIGYDISNLPAATQAFRRHFLMKEKAGELDDAEKKVLYVLMQKYF